jgi:hypothetical protein
MDTTITVAVGAGAAIIGLVIMRILKVGDALEEPAEELKERFNEWQYRNHVLMMMGIVVIVLLFFGTRSIIECYNNPVCIGRDLHTQVINITTITPLTRMNP